MISENVISFLKYVLSDEKNKDKMMFNYEIFDKNDFECIYKLGCAHAILPLFSDCIGSIPDTEHEFVKNVKDAIYTNIYSYSRMIKRQEQLLEEFRKNNIPAVVLKGTSAAKYYPKPQLRTMGDIDLLVKPNNYDDAICVLSTLGSIETTSDFERGKGRHRSFLYKNILIELHYFFSLNSDKEKARLLDNLLYDAINNDSNELSDEENGLVLLSHIGQHLESGLGLRQIIDWMMFVRACLNDEMWFVSFREKAKKTGIETIAITVTKMCQMYLGLTTEGITWCKDGDEKLCNDLLNYVLRCGNFGESRSLLQSRGVSKFPTINHPIRLFHYLQSHGKQNWSVIKKHPCLKSFAWVYQLCRYIRLVFQHKVGPKEFENIYDEGRKRNEMFSALGLK